MFTNYTLHSPDILLFNMYITPDMPHSEDTKSPKPPPAPPRFQHHI